MTNACNARVLNLGMDKDRQVKVMGSDNGRFEEPIFSSFNFLAPGERIIFEVYFLADGINGNPDNSAAVIRSIDPYLQYFNKDPDKNLPLTVRMMFPFTILPPGL